MSTTSAFIRLRVQVTESRHPVLFRILSALPPKQRTVELLRLADLGSAITQAAVAGQQFLPIASETYEKAISTPMEPDSPSGPGVAPQDRAPGIIAGMTSTASLLDIQFGE